MRCTILNAVCAFVFALSVAAAQGQGVASGTSPLPPGTEVTADSMEYLDTQKLMMGDGNVVIVQGDASLTADHVQINTETQWAEARGKVVYRKGSTVWQGESVRYNLKTKQLDTGESTAFVPPWNIKAGRSQRISTNEVLMKDVVITTCDPEHPEYTIRAREARLIDGHHLRAKGVKLNWLGVPFFYLPTYNRDLGAHDYWFEFVPGYSSRNGAYLLSSLNYRMNPEWMGRTRLDYRAERGFGVGEDIMWKGTNEMWDGELNLYYADDDDPYKDEEDEMMYTNLVDNERYRIRLLDFHSLTERDYVIADINYLSDPTILRDFFNEEYRDATVPENRVTLTHRGDRYTAGLTFNKRLNDFYENVDRMPELTYDLQRIRIADTPFYYETENSAAQLERVFPEDSGLDDYDAFRLDSSHRFYYPTRQFGFLTLIPRTGYRGTYYSDTFNNDQLTTTAIVTDPVSGTSGVVTGSLPVVEEAGSDVRNLFELGFETSFKSHKTWNDVIVLGEDDGFRHIAEPYADYTYVPEPDLEPIDLPQFDEVDTLGERNDVEFGIRNKFQTRRRGSVHDLMDFNIYTTYRFDPKEPEEDFSFISFDNELRLWDRFPIDFDGEYDMYESEFATFNSQVSYKFDDLSTVSLEYRYRRDDKDQIASELVLFPNRRWSFQIYHRYDFEGGELEEQEYFVQRKTDCMGYGIGFRETEDDFQVWLRIFLLAFPESTIKLGE